MQWIITMFPVKMVISIKGIPGIPCFQTHPYGFLKCGDMAGEFWYDLSLLAEAAPAEEIAPLECELGRRAPGGQESVTA